MDFSVTERIILAVLAYSAKFNFPLTEKEILRRSFHPKILNSLENKNNNFRKTKFSRKDFQLGLATLVKKKRVTQQGDYYFLSAQDIKPKKVNPKIKQFKEEVISELVGVAERIPWVLGVVITGSYAAGVVEKKDDLDFLIITQENRLWLTRFVFLILSWLKGRRPHLPKGDLSHSWDFNFWLDETVLSLPPHKRDLYEAYEILQTRWVVNKHQIKEQFFKANNWVYDYFLFADLPELKNTKLTTKRKKFDWCWLFEACLYKVQLGYRQLRHGQQNASLHSAFLHSSSTKGDILLDWQNYYYQAVGLSKKVLVTGVFDVLHQEHKNFLLAAKKYGTTLIVGLESDKRVKEIKGKQRPIFNQQQRQKKLANLGIVDEVFILPEKFKTDNDHLKLLKKLKPAVLAVSSHTAHLDKKKKLMERVGGELKVVYQHRPDISSTQLIKDKKQS